MRSPPTRTNLSVRVGGLCNPSTDFNRRLMISPRSRVSVFYPPKNYPRLISVLSERLRTNIRRGLAGLLTGTWLLRETLAKQERI
jgi:hypothetical protein